MHPEYSKKLVLGEIQLAIEKATLFDEKVQLEEIGYPAFYVRFINRSNLVRLLRFDATNYDFQPLAIEPVDLITREPLSPEKWPLRDGAAFPGHFMKNDCPFFCIKGVRDYYTHQGHTPAVSGECWEHHRADYRIPDLILYIKQKFASGSWE
jgi:hypothetical protein